MNFQLTDSALTAYLFECAGDPELLGVSQDKFGSNLPATTCAQGWKLRIAFRLGVHDPVPAPIAPEPILRGIRAHGFYVWRNGNVNKTTGTSQ